MNADSAIAAVQTLLREADWSWTVFGAGMLGGVLLGFALGRLPFRRRRSVRRHSWLRDLLSLTPAIVACLLWGLWLGILAAKSLAH